MLVGVPSVADIKAIMELGFLAVAAFAFIALAVWGFVQLKPVIANNTKAINALTMAIGPVQKCQESSEMVLHEINTKVATKEDITRVHDRLDEQGGNIKQILGGMGVK